MVRFRSPSGPLRRPRSASTTGTPPRPRFSRGPSIFFVALLLGAPLPARGAVPADAPPFPSDPSQALQTTLEKTIFQVNVLTLEIRVDPASVARLDSLAAGGARPSADRVTRLVLGAPQSWVRMEFLRNASQGQFLGGIRDNLKKARAAKIITNEHFDRVSGNLPRWYDFLARRGVKRGDLVLQFIHGDTLETTYLGIEGKALFDLVEEDPVAREGVLGSFLAPGSDFREGLVRSLHHGP